MSTEDEQVLLIEGEDYYFDNGLMVLTAGYLLRRGYCCEQGCRHCPYNYSQKKRETRLSDTNAQRRNENY